MPDDLNPFLTYDIPLDRAALPAADLQQQLCHEFHVHTVWIPEQPPAGRTALQSSDAMGRVFPQIRQLESDPFVFSGLIADVARCAAYLAETVTRNAGYDEGD